MEPATHMGFIIAAYAAAVIVIVGLCAWVILDYRAQRRMLAELERRGVTRRSSAPRAEPAQYKAKEEA
jgi:heme exporter protein CcmD